MAHPLTWPWVHFSHTHTHTHTQTLLLCWQIEPISHCGKLAILFRPLKGKIHCFYGHFYRAGGAHLPTKPLNENVFPSGQWIFLWETSLSLLQPPPPPPPPTPLPVPSLSVCEDYWPTLCFGWDEWGNRDNIITTLADWASAGVSVPTHSIAQHAKSSLCWDEWHWSKVLSLLRWMAPKQSPLSFEMNGTEACVEWSNHLLNNTLRFRGSFHLLVPA